MSSKPVLIARNAKEDTEDEDIHKGIPWEDFVNMDVRMRKEPWRQLEPNLGNAFARSQGSQVTPGNAGGTSAGTSVGPHTHPLSDIVCTYLTLTIVTAVNDDGTNLVYKTRQVTVLVQTSGSESDWTTFAQTATECA